MDIISIINISLSFVTVIVIIWYTCETRKMQLRIKEQIELSLIPMIDISIKNREIINVGHGTAINIVFNYKSGWIFLQPLLVFQYKTHRYHFYSLQPELQRQRHGDARRQKSILRRSSPCKNRLCRLNAVRDKISLS